jgi:hypothetical protein
MLHNDLDDVYSEVSFKLFALEPPLLLDGVMSMVHGDDMGVSTGNSTTAPIVGTGHHHWNKRQDRGSSTHRPL